MCGIIGLCGTSNASQKVFRGLLTLQHRGQDAAGILTYDYFSRRFFLIKKSGLVAQVFDRSDLESLRGTTAIGHTRYSTVGKGEEIDVQPLVLNYPFGIGMVHNGNVVNYHDLARRLLEERHRQMLTTNDVEIIQNIFAEGLTQTGSGGGSPKLEDLARAVDQVFRAVVGGYSVIGIIAEQGLIGFRDPHGIRPLVLGEKDGAGGGQKTYGLASESIALQVLGYRVLRDLLPGELVFVNAEGKLTSKVVQSLAPRPCMFEWVYFAGAESILSERAVYGVRLNLGRELARIVAELRRKGTIKPDIVVPIPETSRSAAVSLAEELKIPYREGLIKNRYIQRSFILQTQEARQEAVELKLNPVRSEIEGKNLLLVDDSIVRGNTSRKIVSLVRSAGAREVYFASTCPPIRYPCYYGIDFPLSEELIAHNRDEQAIAESVQADRVIYMDVPGLQRAIGLDSLCMACLNMDYPTDVSAAQDFGEWRIRDRSAADRKGTA
ncbi:MAG: amidophosphoribosyltransferase [Pseudomonadota bacterium]